jgi:hypothetical protein
MGISRLHSSDRSEVQKGLQPGCLGISQFRIRAEENPPQASGFETARSAKWKLLEIIAAN